MKILMIALMILMFSPAAFAEPLRQAGFSTTRNVGTSGNKMMTREEYNEQLRERKTPSWFSSSNKPIIRKNANGTITMKQSLNNRFGMRNVNAANTLLSNFND